MTGMYEQVRPGIGHNQPDEYAEEKKNQKWERWAKKRTFVRALEGTYSHLYKTLLEETRVYSSQDVPWKGGPGQYGKSVISPQATSIIQSIEIAHRGLCAEDRRPEARPSQQRGVLRAQGPRPRRARRPPHPMEGRRRDAGRERLRASALQRHPKTRKRSTWCSRRSRCSCSCICCCRRWWNGRRTNAGRQALFAADRSLSSARRDLERAVASMSAIEDKNHARSSGHRRPATGAPRRSRPRRSSARNTRRRPNVVTAEDMPWERSPTA